MLCPSFTAIAISNRNDTMKSAIIILSLMGCDDAAKNCEAIEVNNAQFVSEAACLRASESLFEEHASAEYPMIMAKCDLKTPAELAGRPAIQDTDASDAAHEVVTVDLSEPEEDGWFRVGVKESVAKVTKPVADAANGIATKGQDTASWLVDRVWAAVDYVNPF